MIQAVFFDLNGVLILSEYLSDRFEKAYGVPSADFVSALKEVMAVVRKPNAPSMYSLWQPYFEKWGINLTEEQFLDFWFSGESINTEALEYVKELKGKGIKILVVSNNFRERTIFYRKHFPELFEGLDGAYFSWETGYVKPSTDALQVALSEQGLLPEEVVYFDDSEENVEIAKSIGVDGQLWSDLKTAREYIDSKAG